MKNDLVFDNPIVLNRADPWIYRYTGGYYYFTASVPEYDRIELRRAKEIAELSDSNTQVVWTKHLQGPMSKHIWAPEIHYISGVWYIYFAAAQEDNIYHAGDYKEINGDPLFDINRHARAQILNWKDDGMPDFGTPVSNSSISK